MAINAANQALVRAYILRQFSSLSWWPTAGPLQAREAFDALEEDPEALDRWCKTWLDGGQWRQLRMALEQSMEEGSLR